MNNNTVMLAQDSHGRVWTRVRDGGANVSSSYAGVEQFLAGHEAHAFERFRLLGGKRAVDLVLGLGSNPARVVELVTPSLMADRRPRGVAGVLDALATARDVLPAPSVGGPCVMTDAVRAAYVLARRVRDGGDAVAALALHPAWPAMRFVHACDPTALAALLAEVVDPRYFVIPNKPDQSRLPAFLGLHQDYIGPAVGRPMPERVDDRVREKIRLASLTLDCWRRDGFGSDPSDPSRFVWRAYFQASNQGELVANRKASELFVAYLAASWTAALYPHAAERLFVPSHFFDDPATAAACVEHLRQPAVQG